MTVGPFTIRVLEAPGVSRPVRPDEEAAVRAQMRLVAEAAAEAPSEQDEVIQGATR